MNNANYKSRLTIPMITVLFLCFAVLAVAVSDDFTGRKICREAQGPEDTTAFKITLLKDRSVKGSGSFSGATANYSLQSGTWKISGDYLEIQLIFSGKKYGDGNTGTGKKTVMLKIRKSELTGSRSECFEYTDEL